MYAVRLILLVCVCFSSYANAAFEGAAVNPLAFVNEARNELGLGASDKGRLFFQDAAYRSDETPIDGAILLYMSDRQLILDDGVFSLSYRLNLSNGAVDTVYAIVSNQSRRVADGKDLLILLEAGATPEQVQQTVELFQRQFPDVHVSSAPRIRLVKLSWSSPNALQLKQAAELARNSLNPRLVRMESEVYPVPFLFGNALEIPVDGGGVDLDSIRDICHTLLTRGLQFTTSSSNIPPRFK